MRPRCRIAGRAVPSIVTGRTEDERIDGNCRVAVIIPVWNGAAYLRRLLPTLANQMPKPDHVIVVDSSSRDDSAAYARSQGCIVEVIPQQEFNHGGTRNRAAALAPAVCDVLVFMTQDALPQSPDFLARLVAPLRGGTVAGAYARQIPYEEASALEAFARNWNYPGHAARRTADAIPQLGMRAFFFSNVASAVTRAAFDAVGGFPNDVIMNEDMVLCARLLRAGHAVAYCADAVVRHSHDYTIAQQFRRYFDIGVFTAQSSEVDGRLGGAGVRFALGQVAWCWQRGAKRSIPRSLVESAVKYLGMQLGKRHRLLPRRLRRRCSMHRGYWS